MALNLQRVAASLRSTSLHLNKCTRLPEISVNATSLPKSEHKSNTWNLFKFGNIKKVCHLLDLIWHAHEADIGLKFILHSTSQVPCPPWILVCFTSQQLCNFGFVSWRSFNLKKRKRKHVALAEKTPLQRQILISFISRWAPKTREVAFWWFDAIYRSISCQIPKQCRMTPDFGIRDYSWLTSGGVAECSVYMWNDL